MCVEGKERKQNKLFPEKALELRLLSGAFDKSQDLLKR